MKKGDIFPKKLQLGLALAFALGLAGFLACLGLGDPKRAWSAFLTASLLPLFLSLGGLFFLSVQHSVRAVWSVSLRRLMEAMGAFIPAGCAAALFVALFGDSLYIWMDPEILSKDPLLQKKAPYLNRPFFLVRFFIFSGIWIFFAQKFQSLSKAQDKGLLPQADIAGRSFKLSLAFLGAFALSFTFFTVDFLMSLEPHWFSTVFGVYCFAGLFQSSIAALSLLTVYLMKRGALEGRVNENHLHDLGKFLFGATILWAYIAFSQYMLIWYANLPEEALYYHHRSHGGWLWVSLGLVAFKFVVPFLALLPRWVKRSPFHLALVSALILIMQYVDIYWMVYPNYDPEAPRFGLAEVCSLAASLSLFIGGLLFVLKARGAIASKDRRLEESSRHVVTY